MSLANMQWLAASKYTDCHKVQGKKKKDWKYNVILKISGTVLSTGMPRLMTPENAAESQRPEWKKGEEIKLIIGCRGFPSEGKGAVKECLQNRWIEMHLALDIYNNEYYTEEKMSTSYPIS